MRPSVREALRLMTLCAGALYVTGAAADSSRGVLSHIQVRGHGTRAEVLLDGNLKVPTYAVRTRDGGNVIVVDIAGVSLKDETVQIESTDLVTTATATSTAQGVRVELSLRKQASYRARVQDGDVVLSLEEVGASAAPATSAVAPAALANRRPELSYVTLEKRDGRERVVLELSQPAEFRVVPGVNGPARLEIKGIVVAESARRELDFSELSTVSGVALKQQGDRVLVEVDRLADSSATAIREGNRIVWLFAPPLRYRPGQAAARAHWCRPSPSRWTPIRWLRS